MRVQPLSADQIIPRIVETNGTKMKVFFQTSALARKSLEEGGIKSVLEEAVRMASKRNPSPIIFVTQEDVGAYHPEAEPRIRQEVADWLYIESATKGQRLAILKSDCTHCARPYCEVRQQPYVEELEHEISDEELAQLEEARHRRMLTKAIGHLFSN